MSALSRDFFLFLAGSTTMVLASRGRAGCRYTVGDVQLAVRRYKSADASKEKKCFIG